MAYCSSPAHRQPVELQAMQPLQLKWYKRRRGPLVAFVAQMQRQGQQAAELTK
jgi:hypothetical protein